MKNRGIKLFDSLEQLKNLVSENSQVFLTGDYAGNTSDIILVVMHTDVMNRIESVKAIKANEIIDFTTSFEIDETICFTYFFESEEQRIKFIMKYT